MSLGLDIARRKAALPLTIKNLLQKPPLDSFISASGWVKSIRKQKRVAFAEINDGSSEDNLQIVLDPREAAKYCRYL